MNSTTSTFISWNANGVNNKTVELAHFLEETAATACLIQETHLTPARSFRIPNFTVYRTDRLNCQKPAGGVALAIRTTIAHTQIILPPLANIEAVGIELATSNGPLRLISTYLSPTKKMLPSDLDQLITQSHIPTIISGDLNAKNTTWNSKAINAKGRILLAHSRTNNYTVAGPVEPTHYAAATRFLTGDVLDITMFINTRHSIHLKTIQALSSDHNPVQIEYGDEMEVAPTRVRFNLKKAEWDKFRDFLTINSETTAISTTADVDKAVADITSDILAAAEAAIPKSYSRRSDLYDLSPGLRQSVKIKNKARRDWQRLRTPDLRRKYNELSRQFKIEIGKAQEIKWEEAVAKLKIKDQSVWRMTRALQRKKQPNPPLQGKFHLACSDKDKADTFADSLELQFQNTMTSNLIQEVDNSVKQFRDKLKDPALATTCTLAEVGKLVEKLKDKKAPGQDGISNKLIKMLPSRTANRLVEIFNTSLKLNYFPKAWKEAKVILFPKAGKDLKKPENHRPISLLSTLAKLFEKIILTRLLHYIQEKDIYLPEQFGFRAKHATTHQLLRVANMINHGFNTNKATGIVFLDVAKAFDRVWHNGLIHKLIALDIPPYLIHILDSYLKDRAFKVSINEQLSSLRPIAAGVPQGSVLGPVLFNLFTNDIPNNMHKTNIALYADDVAVISSSWSSQEIGKNLQNALDHLSAWYEMWRIQLNNDKTTATLFSRRTKRKHPEPSLFLNAKPITFTNSSKYLGVILDKKLTWTEHATMVKSKAHQKFAALFPLFRTKTMNFETKLTLYKTIIRPIITYASPIWSNSIHNAHIERIQLLQNRVLRMIFQAPRSTKITLLHEQSKLPQLQNVFEIQTINFLDKIGNSSHELINKQLNFTPNPFDKYLRIIHLEY
jgi:hypothetical protein